MTQTEALKIAWEALAYINEGANNQGPHTGISWRCAANKSADAITAIKTALSGEAQTRSVDKDEPVAWRTYTGRGYYIIDKTFEEAEQNWPDRPHSPLYTTPPQRKPLTDETRNWIVATCPTPRHIIDAVERMHGIKGEA